MNPTILSKLKELKTVKDVEGFVQSPNNSIILLEAIKNLTFPKGFNIKNISCKALQTIFSHKGLEKFIKHENVIKLIKANGLLKCMQPYIMVENTSKELPEALTVFQKLFNKNYNMISLFAKEFPLELKKIIPLMVKKDLKYKDLMVYGGLVPRIEDVKIKGHVTIKGNNIELRGHGNSYSRQSLQITLFVAYPTYIEFDMEVGSEEEYDYGRFYINGKQINYWSGHYTKHYKYDIPSGWVTIEFAYTKDCCANYYFDGVNFKNITIGEMKWPLTIR